MSEPSGRLERTCSLLVLLLAAALRLLPLRAALPYLGYVDEGHILHPTITLLKTRSLDPQRYLHPTLLPYLTALAVNAYRPVYRRWHGRSLLADLPPDETYYDAVSPPELILIARLLVVAFGVATVAIAGLLASRLAGPAAGLLAALFTAICPALICRGSIVILDTVAAFCVIAALAVAQRLEEEPSGGAPGLALLAGAFSGLALTAKYTPVTVLAAVLVTVLTRPEPPRRKLALAATACAACAAAAAITMPPLLLRTRDVIQAVLQQARYYADVSSQSPNNPDTSYLRQLLSARECGLGLAATAAAGLLLLLRGHRRTLLSWAAFTAALLFPLLLHPYRPFRQLLTLVPPLCVAAGLAIASLLRERRLVPLGVAAAALVTGTLAAGSARYLRSRLALTDTRTTAVEWLASMTTPASTVLVEEELAFLPSELARVGAEVHVVPRQHLRSLAASRRFDYLVAAPFDLWGRTRPDWIAESEEWSAWLASMNPEGTIGTQPTPVYPNFWRGNMQVLSVYKGSEAFRAQ